MKTGALKILLVLLNFTATHATLIDNDSFTTDTETGLDWLDVTGTTNLSINYVRSQMEIGGAFEGWQYASRVQIGEFWNHAGGNGEYSIESVKNSVWSVENNGLFNRLSPLWGTTYGTTLDGYIAVATADRVSPLSTTNFDMRMAMLLDWSQYKESATMDRTDMLWHMHLDGIYEREGHALIRVSSAVPEPTSISLFAIGLLGIFAVKKRIRKK